MAQELLEVSDQYMLDTLKRLCEQAITDQLSADNVSAAFDLAENFNAPELSKQCAMYCLRQHGDLASKGASAGSKGSAGGGGSSATPAGYAILMQKMAPRVREAVADAITAKNAEMQS